MRLAVGAHGHHRFGLVEAVLALEGHAAAELAGPRLVGHELVGKHGDRLLGLDNLGGGARLVGEHVRVAVEAVGPGPRTPGAAGELDVDERLALRVVAADGDAAVAAVASGFHLVGQHHGQRAVHAVDHAEAGEPACRAGRRQHAVTDGAGRADHLDGAEHAFVVGDVVGQHRAYAGVGRGLGIRQRVVDGAADLRAGAGPIDDHAVAFLADGDEQADRLADIDAVVVDPVLEAPLAVRQIAQRGPCQALGVVDGLDQELFRLRGAVARDQLRELLLGDVAGGELRAQVAQHHDRHAHVLLQERDDGLVELARLVQLHGRDAQPLGVDLGGVGGVGAGDPAADVGVVAHGAGEREALALMVERLHDEDVGQVHAAVERVVHDEDVAWAHVPAEVAHDRLHGGRHRAKVPRQRQALSGQPAVAVGEGGRVVHVVLQHGRIGRAEHRQRHLVGDREDGVLEQLERNRIRSGSHRSLVGCLVGGLAQGIPRHAKAPHLSLSRPLGCGPLLDPPQLIRPVGQGRVLNYEPSGRVMPTAAHGRSAPKIGKMQTLMGTVRTCQERSCPWTVASPPSSAGSSSQRLPWHRRQQERLG